MKTDTIDPVDPAVPDGVADTDLPVANPPLREHVSRALAHYLSQVENEQISDLYQMVLAEVELPLLQAVMASTRSNQTKASAMLGLNRGTLRKKLKQYGML